MPVQATKYEDALAIKTMSMIKELFNDCQPRNFAVRLWDGTTWEAEEGQPTRFTIVINHPGALKNMFWNMSEITLSESYIYNDFDIEGDIESVFALSNYFLNRRFGLMEKLGLCRRLLSLPSGGCCDRAVCS